MASARAFYRKSDSSPPPFNKSAINRIRAVFEPKNHQRLLYSGAHNPRKQQYQALQESFAYGNQLATRNADDDRKAELNAGSSQLISLAPNTRHELWQ